MLTLLMVVLAGMPVHGIRLADDAPAAGAGNDYAFVRFHGAPLASYDGTIAGYEATRPERGQKLNLQSEAAHKYGNRLQAQRANYMKWLAKHYPEVEIVAEYAVTFNGLGLKLNGADLRAISGGPGTAEANLSATFRPAMNTSAALINAQAIWTHMGGQADAGAGLKVGVIDSGIDASHPFLRDEGMSMPEGYPLGDAKFTSNKVIVARVFNQNPWLTAEAVNSHGTHVAGTIGGRAGTSAPLAGDLSGVAPGVWLGNYNVFPGATGSANSLFIAKAVEAAVADGMDVLNLSLGGTAHRGRDLLDMAVNAAADAGVVVAIAASNDGPGFFTVASPGTAENVITVAATTNSRTFAMFLESAALPARTLATTGSQGGEVKAAMTGTYEVWADHAGGDTMACGPLSGTPLDGKIALIQRGVCAFTTKINNAAAAGAKAVIIYQRDDVDSEPIPMSSDGALIPAVMIGRDAGYALAAWTGDRTVTVNHPPEEVAVMPNALADFSSWGPTPNYTLKPDLAAPGVNIYSSVVGGGFEVYQGTSMATPHVAGAAALLLAHSQAAGLGWGPAEVKAALMATAQDAAMGHDPLTTGAGIIDLAAAMSPSAMAMPSSLSYGLVRPVGNQSYQLSFTLSNPTAAEQTYTLAESMGRLALSATEVTLGAGESASITAMVVYRGFPAPGHHEHELVRGYISATAAGGSAVRIPYLYVIDYNR